MKFEKALLLAGVVLGGIMLSARADNALLYHLGFDGSAENTGSGSQSVTKTGNADIVWDSTAKYGSKSLKVSNASAYVIDNIETTKAEGWTFSFWFHPNGIANWKDILSLTIGGKQGKIEKKNTNKLAIYPVGSGGLEVNELLTYTDNTWNHIAFVSTASGCDVYVNGNKENSIDIDSPAGLTKLILGNAGYDGARTSSALIDEVSVYNFVASSEQLAILANASVPSDIISVTEIDVAEDTTWSALLAAGGLTPESTATRRIKLLAQNTPTITFDTTGNAVAELAVEGPVVLAADESVYVDGCFGVTLLSSALLTLDEAPRCKVKAGYNGTLTLSGNEICLYAQNHEVISINIGGGNGSSGSSPAENLVSGIGYYGIYPVPGESWNNISGQWQGGRKTVTLTSAKAYDGVTTSVRNTIQLSGTAQNTWCCSSITNPFLRGYLDDGGEGVRVDVTGIPYSQYDVIVYLTSDDVRYPLRPININGTWWTYTTDGVLTESDGQNGYDGASWGAGVVTTPTIGRNAILITDVTGTDLAVSGYCPSISGGRATVCAVQIISRGELTAKDFTANLIESTSWSAGTGAGLVDRSGGWNNGSMNAITITNTAENATLTLDGEIVAASLKIVNSTGKTLRLAKAAGASLEISNYNLTEAPGIVFDFDPDFATVDAGENWVGYSCPTAGVPLSGIHYLGDGNAWELGTMNGGRYWIDGSGTLNGITDLIGNAEMTISGRYEIAEGAAICLAGTHGTLTIDEGADITVSNVKLQNNSASDTVATMNVYGRVTVVSSSGPNVYDVRQTSGILFGHWAGSTVVNVGPKGSIIAANCWMQMSYSSRTTMTIDGGYVKVKGLNAGGNSATLTVTNGGTLELSDGLVNQNNCAYTFDNGTIKCAAADTLSWTPTLTQVGERGLTLDVNGKIVAVTGALSGTGPVSILNSAAEAGTAHLLSARPEGSLSLGENCRLMLTALLEEQTLGEIALHASAETAASIKENLVVIDTTGATIPVIGEPTYDAESSLLTIRIGANVISTDSQTSEWAGRSGGVVVANPDEEEITISFDAPIPEGVTKIDVLGRVRFVVDDDVESLGSAVLDIHADAVVTIVGRFPFASVQGTGELVFDPGAERVVVVGSNNSSFTGSCTIASGTVKMGGKYCLGAWNMNRNIVVKTDATLDTNGAVGQAEAQSYRITLEAGARFVNTGRGDGDRKYAAITSGLRLRGDAVVSTDTALSCGCHYNRTQSPIDVDAFTLTKTGTGALYYTSPVISGTGLVDIREGAFEMSRTYGGAQPSFNNGTLRIGGDAKLKLISYLGDTSLTVKNLVMDGSVEMGSSSVLTVNGELSGSGTMPRVTLGTASKLKLDGVSSLTFAGPLTLANDAKISLNLSEIDLSKASSIPVLRVTERANMPDVQLLENVPQKYVVRISSDGLSCKIVRPQFIVVVR